MMNYQGRERGHAIRIEGPEFISNGLLAQTPFEQAISAVSLAYGVSRKPLQIALISLARSKDFSTFRESDHFSARRRNSLIHENSNHLLTLRSNIEILRNQGDLYLQGEAPLPHSSVFERAMLVLLFGHDEIASHSPEQYLKRYRPYSAKDSPATSEQIAGFDSSIPEDFKGLDIFPGWDEYLKIQYHGSTGQRVDNPFDKAGEVIMGKKALAEATESYAKWANQRYGIPEDETIAEVIDETFGPNGGFSTEEALEQVLRSAGGSRRQTYILREAIGSHQTRNF